MSPNGSSIGGATWWRKLALDDIVITFTFIVGIIGALCIRVFLPDIEPLWSAIFLGVAIASFVYRFLGGISQSTSIIILGFKLGGSLAALLACTLLINDKFEKQRKMNPRKNLTLSFLKGFDPIKKRITVQTSNNVIEAKGNKYILPFKDLEASTGDIVINYKPEEEMGEKNHKNICMRYKDDQPEIILYLDFLEKKDTKVLPAQNLTLIFMKGTTVIKDKGLTIQNERYMEITMNDSYEFILPPDFFKPQGYINIVRKQKEEIITPQEPIQIRQLQYKIDPHTIIVHLEKY